MSLNWNVEDIPDDVCWLPAKPGQSEDQRQMNPVTHALIYAMMAIDMSGITKKNVDEVFTRIDACQLANGPFLHEHVPDPKLAPLVKAANSLYTIVHSQVHVVDSKYDAALSAARRAIDDGQKCTPIPLMITYDDCVRHIGLNTNVGTKSRAFFARKLGTVICDTRARYLRTAKREKEEAATP